MAGRALRLAFGGGPKPACPYMTFRLSLLLIAIITFSATKVTTAQELLACDALDAIQPRAFRLGLEAHASAECRGSDFFRIEPCCQLALMNLSERILEWCETPKFWPTSQRASGRCFDPCRSLAVYSINVSCLSLWTADCGKLARNVTPTCRFFDCSSEIEHLDPGVLAVCANRTAQDAAVEEDFGCLTNWDRTCAETYKSHEPPLPPSPPVSTGTAATTASMDTSSSITTGSDLALDSPPVTPSSTSSPAVLWLVVIALLLIMLLVAAFYRFRNRLRGTPLQFLIPTSEGYGRVELEDDDVDGTSFRPSIENAHQSLARNTSQRQEVVTNFEFDDGNSEGSDRSVEYPGTVLSAVPARSQEMQVLPSFTDTNHPPGDWGGDDISGPDSLENSSGEWSEVDFQPSREPSRIQSSLHAAAHVGARS